MSLSSPDLHASEGGASRSADVYADIRHEIVAGILPPGGKLSPAALAKKYKVSASVVRESLTRLAGERFARWSPQQGFTIATATEEEFVNLVKVRTLIDSEGLRISVMEGDLAWKGALVSANYMLANSSGSDGPVSKALNGFRNVHQNFHSALVSGCKNPVLIALSRQLYDENEIYRHYIRILYPGALERSSEHHDRLVEAALSGNADEAVAILVAHYDKSMRDLIASSLLRTGHGNANDGEVASRNRTKAKPNTGRGRPRKVSREPV